MKSLIKWVGGKNKLFNIIEVNNILSDLKYSRIVEPFCGSCSLTFLLKPSRALLNDINFPLINFYRQIQSNYEDTIEHIKYYNSNELNNKESYNEIRNKFNSIINDPVDLSEFAAIFLYLNKRSFNGIYRVNSKGFYNVPYKKYNGGIYNEDLFNEIHEYLSNNDIIFMNVDYKNLLSEIEIYDFVYLDPVYHISDTSKFVSYDKNPINHEELYNFCSDIDNMCIQFMQSNSPSEYIINLYKGFEMSTFKINRQMRSGKGLTTSNDKPNEIIIYNFPTGNKRKYALFLYTCKSINIDNCIFSSKTIKEYNNHFKTSSEKELRLLFYIPQYNYLPKWYIRRGLSIIPIQNGKYTIINKCIYKKINYNNFTKVYEEKYTIIPDILKDSYSEQSKLSLIYINGFIDKYFDDKFWYIYVGRKYCSENSFKINNNEIKYNSVQYEIDGIFESENKIIIVEVKNSTINNFNIRQLYFALNDIKTNKKIIPLLIIFGKNSEIYFIEFDINKNMDTKIVNQFMINIV